MKTTKKMKFLFSSMVVGALAAIGGNAVALEQDEIVLGGLVSMTGAGSVVGSAFVEGTRMAVDEINADGGILGAKLKLVLADTQTNPSVAVSETMRLIHREKIDALIGPAISQETGAVVPLTTRSKILQVSSAGSLELTPEIGPYHFSIIANAEGQGVAMVDGAVDHFNTKRPALLVDNGGQARTAVGAMKKQLEVRGVEDYSLQEYQYNAEDLTPQLLALRNDNPDTLLFFLSAPGDLRSLLEGLENIGWDIPVIGSLSISSYSESLSNDVPEHYFDQVYGVIYPGFSYCPGDEIGQAAFSKYHQRYVARDVNLVQAPVAVASYYYSSVYLLKAAIENTNSLDAEVLSEWLENESSGTENLYGEFAASDKSHFMFGSDSLILGKSLHSPREDNTFLRYACDPVAE